MDILITLAQVMLILLIWLLTIGVLSLLIFTVGIAKPSDVVRDIIADRRDTRRLKVEERERNGTR